MSWYETVSAKIIRRVPELADKVALVADLVEDALHEIVDYANANSYETKWDRVLIKCVAEKYNTIGVEGSVSRSANGVGDAYESTEPTSQTISRNVAQYVRPSGYVYGELRYSFPNNAEKN